MNQNGTHSIQLIESRCVGCTDCIKRCPTEAIRVRNGKAQIIDDRCIDCGMCIRVCRNRAKAAITHSMKMRENFKVNIAIPAPALYGQFKGKFTVNQILTGIKKLGFDDVFEVAFAAQMVTAATKRYLKENTDIRPLISSACPATIRLIATRFPSLIENIIPMLSPMEVAAECVKQMYMQKGYQRDEIGVFFLTPCAAKATYVNTPIGLEHSSADGAISIVDIFMPLRNILNAMKPHEVENLTQAMSDGMRWALAGGELDALHIDNAVAVDGQENVLKIMELLENGQLDDVDFIEALSCTGGCVGGPLTLSISFEARNYMNRAIAKAEAEAEKREVDINIDKINFEFTRSISRFSVMSLDEDMSEAIRKLEVMEEISSTLPAIDCGSCGAPTCKALSEDIVRGNANIEDCVFMLRKKVRDLAEMMVDLSAKMPQTMSSRREQAE